MGSRLDGKARFQLAHFGDAIGDPSRAAMLVALIGGVSRPASELARAAGVTASTATSHLQRLVQAGLLTVRAQGRHRYYALSGPRVAHAVESIVTLDDRPVRARETIDLDPMVVARVCYAHLAGRTAIAFWTRAVEAGWVSWSETGATLLPAGREVWTAKRLLVDAPPELSGRLCLDWSERVPHVSGRLGIAVCNALLEGGWMRRARASRVLRITARGHEGFAALGVRVD